MSKKSRFEKADKVNIKYNNSSSNILCAEELEKYEKDIATNTNRPVKALSVTDGHNGDFYNMNNKRKQFLFVMLLLYVISMLYRNLFIVQNESEANRIGIILGLVIFGIVSIPLFMLKKKYNKNHSKEKCANCGAVLNSTEIENKKNEIDSDRNIICNKCLLLTKRGKFVVPIVYLFVVLLFVMGIIANILFI